jgi:hypothetical protein
LLLYYISIFYDYARVSPDRFIHHAAEERKMLNIRNAAERSRRETEVIEAIKRQKRYKLCTLLY